MNNPIWEMCRSCLRTDCSLTEDGIDIETQTFVPHMDRMKYCFNDIAFVETTTGYKLCETCYVALQTAYILKRRTEESELKYAEYVKRLDETNDDDDDKALALCADDALIEECIKAETSLTMDSRAIVDDVLLDLIDEDGAAWKSDVDDDDDEDEVRVDESESQAELRCRYCDKPFRNKSTLNEHVNKHTGHKPYRCKYCNKSFGFTSSFARHVRIHKGDRPYVCRLCNKTFVDEPSLNEHSRIHAEANAYACKYCTKTFRFPNARKRHERVHTGERPFKCKRCDKSFIDTRQLRMHEKMHTDRRRACKYCGDTFDNYWQFKDHQGAHTVPKATCATCRQTIERPIDDGTLNCKYCDKMFKYMSDRRRHEKTHTRNVTAVCDGCRAAAAVVDVPSTNRVQTLGGDCDTLDETAIVPSFLVGLRDEDVDAAIDAAVDAALNVMEKSPEQPTQHDTFDCKHCTKTFRTPAAFKRHSKLHTDERPYECDACGKAFTTKRYLKAHASLHNGETMSDVMCRRLKLSDGSLYCERCNNVFSIDSVTERSGGNLLDCLYCGKTFRYVSDRKRHENTHAKRKKALRCIDCVVASTVDSTADG